VRRAQQDFPQLTVRLALEVDYLPDREDWIRSLVTRHPWDYLIGSVHYVSDSWAVDNPHQLAEWSRRDAWEVWSTYFERLSRAAAMGCFDILGHADLPKKFGHRPTQDCAPLYEKFLEVARQRDCAVELNTAGLRKDCREIYPHRQLLEMAFQKGVPITFGSDAHAPEEVGMGFPEAVELACSVGYREYRQFEQRKRRSLTLSRIADRR